MVICFFFLFLMDVTFFPCNCLFLVFFSDFSLISYILFFVFYSMIHVTILLLSELKKHMLEFYVL